MGGGVQAEVWSGSRGLLDAEADAEGFVRLVQERYTNTGGGDLETGFKGVKGFGVKEVQGCSAREGVKAKKDPRGVAPRV